MKKGARRILRAPKSARSGRKLPDDQASPPVSRGTHHPFPVSSADAVTCKPRAPLWYRVRRPLLKSRLPYLGPTLDPGPSEPGLSLLGTSSLLPVIFGPSSFRPMETCAFNKACAVFAAPRFSRAWRRCFSIVAWESPSIVAISAVVLPRATQRNTSLCRAVNSFSGRGSACHTDVEENAGVGLQLRAADAPNLGGFIVGLAEIEQANAGDGCRTRSVEADRTYPDVTPNSTMVLMCAALFVGGRCRCECSAAASRRLNVPVCGHGPACSDNVAVETIFPERLANVRWKVGHDM